MWVVASNVMIDRLPPLVTNREMIAPAASLRVNSCRSAVGCVPESTRAHSSIVMPPPDSGGRSVDGEYCKVYPLSDCRVVSPVCAHTVPDGSPSSVPFADPPNPATTAPPMPSLEAVWVSTALLFAARFEAVPDSDASVHAQ